MYYFKIFRSIYNHREKKDLEVIVNTWFTENPDIEIMYSKFFLNEFHILYKKKNLLFQSRNVIEQ